MTPVPNYTTILPVKDDHRPLTLLSNDHAKGATVYFVYMQYKGFGRLLERRMEINNPSKSSVSSSPVAINL